MIRRRKADVIKDLPEKLYSFVPMELANETEYRIAEEEFIQYLRWCKRKKKLLKKRRKRNTS